MMKRRVPERGFTLLELMVVVAVLGILAAFAIPSYQGYLTQARQAALRTAVQSMAVPQSLYQAEQGAYSGQGWRPGDGATETGWLPPDGADTFTYKIRAGADGYSVAVSDPASGESLVVDFGTPPAPTPVPRGRLKPPLRDDEGEEEEEEEEQRIFRGREPA